MLEALCRSSGTTLDIRMSRDGPPITQRTSGLIRENRVKNRFRPEKPPRPPPKIHLNQSLVGGPLPARAGSLFAACRVAKTAIRVETGGQAAASELLIRHEEYTAIVAPRWQSSIVGGR